MRNEREQSTNQRDVLKPIRILAAGAVFAAAGVLASSQPVSAGGPCYSDQPHPNVCDDDPTLVRELNRRIDELVSRSTQEKALSSFLITTAAAESIILGVYLRRKCRYL